MMNSLSTWLGFELDLPGTVRRNSQSVIISQPLSRQYTHISRGSVMHERAHQPNTSGAAPAASTAAAGQPLATPDELMGPIFSQAVLGLLFALTFRQALEVACGGLAGYQFLPDLWNQAKAYPAHYLFRFLQLAAFLATLFRFYAGAYRFHQEPPENVSTPGIVLDLVGTALLFVGFYLAALTVAAYGLFLLLVAVFHVADIGWFILSGAVTKRQPHVQKIVNHYLAYDLITIVAAIVAAIVYAVKPFPYEYFQLISTVILFAMFVVDMLVYSRDWYFRPAEWRKRYG